MRRRDGLRRALTRLTARFDGQTETPAPYRSPQEIALQNAARSLGVELGEYYPQDAEGGSPPSTDADRGDDRRADAAREELLTYVARLGAERSRRRRALRIGLAGALAAVVAITGGVLAVGSPSGAGEVPSEAERSPQRRPIDGPAAMFATAPAPFGTSVASEVSVGGGKIVNSTYLNRSGDVCSALSEVRDGVSERNTGSGCRPPTDISGDLTREPAMVASILVLARRTVIQGYARPDVERIAGRSIWGGVAAALAPAWIPDGGDDARSLPVRPFLVVARHGGRGRRLQPEPLAERALDDRTYNLTAELRDGRVVPVGSPRTPGRDRRDRLVDPIFAAFAD